MTPTAYAALGIALLIALYGLFHWLRHVTPVDRDEDAVESEYDALTVIDASRPAPLEQRPRVRGNSAYGETVQ